jgi:hypothetical protein
VGPSVALSLRRSVACRFVALSLFSLSSIKQFRIEKTLQPPRQCVVGDIRYQDTRGIGLRGIVL